MRKYIYTLISLYDMSSDIILRNDMACGGIPSIRIN